MAQTRYPIVITVAAERLLHRIYRMLRGSGGASPSGSTAKLLRELQSNPHRGRVLADGRTRSITIPPISCKFELHKITHDKRTFDVVVIVEFFPVAAQPDAME
jgi:hypothetical protein